MKNDLSITLVNFMGNPGGMGLKRKDGVRKGNIYGRQLLKAPVVLAQVVNNDSNPIALFC